MRIKKKSKHHYKEAVKKYVGTKVKPIELQCPECGAFSMATCDGRAVYCYECDAEYEHVFKKGKWYKYKGDDCVFFNQFAGIENDGWHWEKGWWVDDR
jgi:hypothetical protein